MMHTKTLTGSLIAVAMLLPSMAGAYSSPEETFYYAEPPSPREVHDRVAAQQQRSADRRAQEQEEAFGTGEEETFPAEEEPSEDPAHESAPDLEDILKSIDEALDELNGSGPDSEDLPEDTRTQRLLERLEDRDISSFPSEEVLRSGAPLADTGAGTIVAGLALLAAAVWTLVRAHRQPKSGKIL